MPNEKNGYKRWEPFADPPQKGEFYKFNPCSLFAQVKRANGEYLCLSFSGGTYIGRENGHHILKGKPSYFKGGNPEKELEFLIEA